MKEVVLQLELFDEKIKQKVMKAVSNLKGVALYNLNMIDKKLTVTGDIDPVILVAKLKEFCPTRILTVNPANKAKKKEEPKREFGKTDDKNIVVSYFEHYKNKFAEMVMPKKKTIVVMQDAQTSYKPREVNTPHGGYA